MARTRTSPSSRLRWVAVTFTVGALAAALGACSSSASDGGTARSTSAPPPSSTTTAADAPPPEQYDGPVDGFYDVPDSLPPGEPGELIGVQDLGEEVGELGIAWGAAKAHLHKRRHLGR